MSFEYPEGATALDPDEMDGLKFKHITTREQLDHLEQANIQDGLIWLKRHKGSDILTEKFIRLLHVKLFGDVWLWAGQFRKTEKNIGVDPLHISVELRNLLDDARFWIDNKIYTPLENAVRVHHRMVYIHLFPNGNGRHARIIANTLLIKIYKQSAIDWSGNFDLQNMNIRRTHYIQALRSADAGDIQPLMNFVSNESK